MYTQYHVAYVLKKEKREIYEFVFFGLYVIVCVFSVMDIFLTFLFDPSHEQLLYIVCWQMLQRINQRQKEKSIILILYLFLDLEYDLFFIDLILFFK